MILNRFHRKYINSDGILRDNWRMGQTTRSQGISFTYEMWDQIEARCKALKCGRSAYFQMLVESDLRLKPETHAHKSDGKWHFFPEAETLPGLGLAARAAEDPVADAAAPKRRRR